MHTHLYAFTISGHWTRASLPRISSVEMPRPRDPCGRDLPEFELATCAKMWNWSSKTGSWIVKHPGKYCFFWSHQQKHVQTWFTSTYTHVYDISRLNIHIYIYIYTSISISICLSLSLSIYIYIVYVRKWAVFQAQGEGAEDAMWGPRRHRGCLMGGWEYGDSLVSPLGSIKCCIQSSSLYNS